MPRLSTNKTVSRVLPGRDTERLVPYFCRRTPLQLFADNRKLLPVLSIEGDRDTAGLAPDDKNRVYMADRLDALRETQRGMFLISFPGDERAIFIF